MVKICYYRKRKRTPYHIADCESSWLNREAAADFAIEWKPADWRHGDRVTVQAYPTRLPVTYTFRVVNIGHAFGVNEE